MKTRILVISPSKKLETMLGEALGANFEFARVTELPRAIATLERERFDLVIADEPSAEDATEIATATDELNADIPVVLIAGTTAGELDSPLVHGYVEAPATESRLRYAVAQALERAHLRRENNVLKIRLGEHVNEAVLIGHSVQVRHLREKVRIVAAASANVLITGENGSGKHIIAHEIHRRSPRAQRPFVAVSCGVVSPSLFERELFGFETRGRTDAQDAPTARRGRIEFADHGTLLVEDIDKLDIETQTKLFSLIQTGRFQRVGSREERTVDIRVVATTTVDLKAEVTRGNFREDLYYRLNVAPVEAPPLRERREDIPLLVDHFVQLYADKHNTKPIVLTDGAVTKLCNAYWEGNIRQLRSEVERAVVMRSGGTFTEDDFHFETGREAQLSAVERAFRFGSIREMERLMILNRLRENDENRTRSAESLEISVRTLRNKLNEYKVARKARARDKVLIPTS